MIVRFVTLLPEKMADVIHAPLPFIAGLHNSVFQKVRKDALPDDIVIVSVDENLLGSHEAVPRLPGLIKLEDQLTQQLRAFHIPENHAGKETGKPLPIPVESARLEIRKIFFNFFVDLLFKYQDCIVLPQINSTIFEEGSFMADDLNYIHFNVPAFLRKTTEVYHPFYRKFFATQMFVKFIEDRLEENSQGIKYFDTQIEARKNRSSSGELLLRPKTKRMPGKAKIVRNHSVNLESIEADVLYFYEKFPVLAVENLAVTLRKDLSMSILSPKLEDRNVRRRSGKSRKSMSSRGKIFFGNSSSTLNGFKEMLRSYYACWILLYCYECENCNLSSLKKVVLLAHKRDHLLLDLFVYEKIMSVFCKFKRRMEAGWLISELKKMDSKPSAKIYGMYMEILTNPTSINAKKEKSFWLFRDDIDLSGMSMQVQCECSQCNLKSFEEDILCEWVIDDSDASEVQCSRCNHSNSPFLLIKNEEGMEQRVPYLKPSIIELELELQMSSNSLCGLKKMEIAEKHPILFWNLVWIFSDLQFDFYEENETEKQREEGETLNENKINEGKRIDGHCLVVCDLKRFLQKYPMKRRRDNNVWDGAAMVGKKEEILSQLLTKYLEKNNGESGCYVAASIAISKLGIVHEEEEFVELYNEVVNGEEFKKSVSGVDRGPSAMQLELRSVFHHLQVFPQRA